MPEQTKETEEQILAVMMQTARTLPNILDHYDHLQIGYVTYGGYKLPILQVAAQDGSILLSCPLALAVELGIAMVSAANACMDANERPRVATPSVPLLRPGEVMQ